MDRLEEVTVEIGGQRVGGWTAVEISAGAEAAVRTARVSLASIDETATGSLPVPGDPAVVRAGGDAMVTGFVRDVSPAHDGSGRSLDLSIASATADLTEASVDHPTGYVEEATLDQIAKALGSELTITVKARLRRHEYVQTVPGETLHKMLARIARREGVLIHDDGDGAIVLADKPEGRHAGGIETGVNILAASATWTEAGRHDEWIVRGQAARGHGDAALRIEGRSKDGDVKRRRPKVIVLEGESTDEAVRRRAEWAQSRAAGRALRASVTVPGWRDAAGVLWAPNFLVFVKDAWLAIEQDMAVASVSFTQDEGGTRATLALVDPRAFGGEDPKGKSGTGWAVPRPKPVVGAK